MNIGLRVAVGAIGLINASFIGIVAAELASPVIGWIAGALTLGLEAWGFRKMRALIAQPPQAQDLAQETQA